LHKIILRKEVFIMVDYSLIISKRVYTPVFASLENIFLS